MLLLSVSASALAVSLVVIYFTAAKTLKTKTQSTVNKQTNKQTINQTSICTYDIYTCTPAMIAFVVAMAGMIFPAIPLQL